jgi:hypothetical protein
MLFSVQKILFPPGSSARLRVLERPDAIGQGVHAPLEHPPPPQECPQVPQFLASEVRSAHPVGQHVCDPVHAALPWQPQPLAMQAFDVDVVHIWHIVPPVPHTPG